MKTYNLSQVEEDHTIQDASPSLQECLRAVAMGLPLPGGALELKNGRTTDKFVCDYKIADDLTHIEMMRRNLEKMTSDFQSIAKARAAMMNVAKKQQVSESGSEEQVKHQTKEQPKQTEADTY